MSGNYDKRYQVLLDNQVDNTVVGYHVLTPLQIEGAKEYILVNLSKIIVEITGTAILSLFYFYKYYYI